MQETKQKIYTTTSTFNNAMDVNPIVLRETLATRLIFKPIWVSESENPSSRG